MAGRKHISSEEARAASAHSRINIPLNLDNWKTVEEKYHQELLWFHQHILDQGMGWKDVEEAVGYDGSSIHKFLKGTSTGSYANFCAAIRSYRKIAVKRQTITQTEFVHNSITRLIYATLDYTFANNSATMIIGESCLGKSTTMQAWRDENNHGRSVYVDCPSVGGNKGFLASIAEAVGVGKNLPTPQMLAGVKRSFNRNRILLLDNMHRAMPGDTRSAPKAFDIVQEIFDGSGCAVAMSATARLDSQMRHTTYMYEQISGRCGVPVYLPTDIKADDIRPIVAQYLPKPSKIVMQHALRIANQPGRIRQLVERLKLASRIAGKKHEDLTEEHFLRAIRVRQELSKHNKNQQEGK